MTTKTLNPDEQRAYENLIHTFAHKAKSNYRLRQLPCQEVRKATQNHFDGAIALGYLDSVSFSLYEKIMIRARRQYDVSYAKEQRNTQVY